MRIEKERIKSFVGWPFDSQSPVSLARNGLYYLGRGNEVRCAFCKIEILNRHGQDDFVREHVRWSPQCPFRRCLSESASKSYFSANAPLGVISKPSPVRDMGPVHHQYASKDARLDSFRHWPMNLRQPPEELGDAGFFYTGRSDCTLCFYCGGGLNDWEEHDVPWKEHARWFERCPYLLRAQKREAERLNFSSRCPQKL